MSRFTVLQGDAQVASLIPFWKTEQRLFAYLLPRVRNQAGRVYSDKYSSLDTDLKSQGDYEQHVAAESGDYVTASWTMGAVYADDQVSGLQKEYQGEEGSLASGTLKKIGPVAMAELKAKFMQRFRTRLWNAAGASLNSGGGVEFLGITQAISQTPSSGTYAGISRSTYSNWQNQQISGASGPSSAWTSDAWERILTLHVATRNSEGKRRAADMMLCTATNYVQILNKAFSQNTNLGAEIGVITSVDGMEAIIDDDVGSGLVYMLDSKSWEVIIPPGRKKENMGIKMYAKSEIPEQVHQDDEVLVMSFVGTPICKFPKANGVITSAS